jgi:hypothetical protein
MRKLLDDDRVPVLVTTDSGLGVEQRSVAAAKVPIEDDQVSVVLMNEGQFKAARCRWAMIRIDDGGTCYDSPNDGRTIVAFAQDYGSAMEYAAERGAGRDGGRLGQHRLADNNNNLDGIVAAREKASLARKTGTGTAQDVRMAASELAARWANCGNTSHNLCELLDATGGLEKLQRKAEINDAEVFEAVLNAWMQWKEPLLLDISFHNIHTFCLELHLDGGYLVQGYQGAYTAFWWEAITDEPFLLPGVRTDKPVRPDQWVKHEEQATQDRKSWGSGRKLSREQIRELLAGVAGIVAAGRDGAWTPDAHAIFVKLPFYAGQSPGATIGTLRPAAAPSEKNEKEVLTEKPAGLLAVDLTIFRFQDLPAAYRRYRIEEGSLSLAILKQVYGEMDALSTQTG